MLELFHASYLSLDLLIGFGTPVALLVARRLGWIGLRSWAWYWLGAAVGVWLIRRLWRTEPLRRFRTRELAALLGQATELLVELSATLNNAWAFVPTYRWNPVLFPFRGHAITLLPQLIWLAAPVLFYLLALRLSPPLPHDGADPGSLPEAR